MSAGSKRGRNRVEVKLGARGRSLRIDGTFASWYRPGTPITGSVWDALAAPFLLLPERPRRRVLILGLGGGSAARVIRAIAPSAQITGVELDPEVVDAARRFFDLDHLGVELVADDARHYLAATRRRFDLILEDVFIGAGNAVHKPHWLPAPGLSEAKKRLAPGGVLATNAIDEAAEATRVLERLFLSTLRIGVEDYDNQIVVGASFALSGRSLRAAVRRCAVLGPTASRLRFRRGRGRREGQRRGLAVSGGRGPPDPRGTASRRD